jgi:hypothetical protein
MFLLLLTEWRLLDILNLQFLYGAHELRIVKPFILSFLDKHLFFLNFLGNLKILPSDFLSHNLCFLLDLQQSIIFFIINLKI